MHILFAVDGSDGSKDAARTLAATPFPKDTRLTLLHVTTRYVPSSTATPKSLMASLREDEDARARAVVKEARELIGKKRFAIEERLVEGGPAEQITNAAADLSADLIVLGALGLTGWMRVLLGSTSLAVVRHAPCPVWVVKKRPKQGRFDVLVATDGSANIRHAIDVVKSLPFPKGAVAHLMHVLPSLNDQLHLTGTEQDPPVLAPLYETGQHFRTRGEHLIREDRDALAGSFKEVRTFMVEGETRREILKAATEVSADLIVMGSKGQSAIREFLLGSISHNVLKHARTSVLIVPPND